MADQLRTPQGDEIWGMIFSAGLGTRFKPWTDHHPKALAVVNGKSLLRRNIEYLAAAGIRNVVVNVHHFSEQIIKAIEENNGWGSNIIISDEKDEVLETGGGLLKARPLLEGKTFLTLNVDILTDACVADLVHFHFQQKSLVSLAVTARNTSRYLLFDSSNRLCGWRNVSTGEERISIQKEHYLQKAYSGMAVFQPKIFELIQQQGKFSLIDVFLSLAHEYPIMGFDHTGDKLIDVGKPESVQRAEVMFS